MSEPASISSGIANRYATAVFELAKDSNKLDVLEKDLGEIEAVLGENAEFRDLISSPVYSRDQQAASIGAIAKKMGLSELVANTLGLMAGKRRLFVLPQLVAGLRAMIAEEKGEITADVIAATALNAARQKDLAASLKASTGKDVKINTTVDESLIGGLIVKVGSKMIDTSIRSKLNALQNTMKEVG